MWKGEEGKGDLERQGGTVTLRTSVIKVKKASKPWTKLLLGDNPGKKILLWLEKEGSGVGRGATAIKPGKRG